MDWQHDRATQATLMKFHFDTSYQWTHSFQMQAIACADLLRNDWITVGCLARTPHNKPESARRIIQLISPGIHTN
jgi:hypothetical protein